MMALNTLRLRLRLLRGRYSQDAVQAILEALFRDRATGFYIDVGAHHPMVYSNSYALYRKGWRGLCLEPNGALHARFAAARPGDRLVAAAAGDRDGDAVFHLGRHDVHGSLHRSSDRHVDTMPVRVRRLDGLLVELGEDRPIDLVSIDTEGTEIDVLEGLDLARNRPRIIVAEYNTAGTINMALQPYLLAHGYQVLAVTRWNIVTTDRFDEDCHSLGPDRAAVRGAR